MSKTVTLEDLPKPVGGIVAYDLGTELSDEERREIESAIQQGESDYAAGRYSTLEEFKTKYTSKLEQGNK